MNKHKSAVHLAKKIIAILDVKCKKGCTGENATWQGFQNGNGIECGSYIEQLIEQAKRFLKT